MYPRADDAALPPDLEAFASEIYVVQQRIQRSEGSSAQAATWSRELRRAVQVGRHDLAEGRARLADLASALAAREPGKP